MSRSEDDPQAPLGYLIIFEERNDEFTGSLRLHARGWALRRANFMFVGEHVPATHVDGEITRQHYCDAPTHVLRLIQRARMTSEIVRSNPVAGLADFDVVTSRDAAQLNAFLKHEAKLAAWEKKWGLR